MRNLTILRHAFVWGCCLLAGAWMTPVRAAEAAPNGPGDVDLSANFSKWRLGIKWQQRRDTCAVFTVTGALEYALAKKLGRGSALSEEYLNWAANDASREYEDGASFPELVQGFKRWGICGQQFMPYNSFFSPAYQPTRPAADDAHALWEMGFRWHVLATGRAQGLTNAHLEAAKDVLQRGFPVCGGGKHCLLLVGYVDDPRQPGGGFFRARDYATSRAVTRTYEEVKAMFHSLMWVDLPAK